MTLLTLISLFTGCLFTAIECQCTLPFTPGTWISTSRGTWTVSDDQITITNFEADLAISQQTTTLDCVSNTGTLYIMHSNFELFVGLFTDVYTCIDIQETSASPASYYFYFVTGIDAITGEKFTGDQNSACSNTNYQNPNNLVVAYKDGSGELVGVNFPDVMLGNYSVTYETINGVKVEDSNMTTCDNTTAMSIINSNTAYNPVFSSGGELFCMHYVTSGSYVYVYTYNRDVTVNPSSTPSSYRLACWVVSYSGSGVAASVFPRDCQQGQTPTATPYGGQLFQLTPYYVCPLNSPAVEEGLEGWLIALIVILILLAVAVTVVIVIYCITRRQKIARDEEESIIKGERNPSPDSLPDDDLKKEKLRAQEEFDRSVQKSPLKSDRRLQTDNKVREHTMDLVEVKKKQSTKLQDGQIKTTPRKQTIDTKDNRRNVKDQVKDKVAADKDDRQNEPKEKTDASKETETDTNKRKEDLPPIEFPEGKYPIPPTHPRPDEDDTALLRIRKERERKEKERLEREKKKQKDESKKNKDKEEKPVLEKEQTIIRHVRESSSPEYETDDSEREERLEKLKQKRKRLKNAEYQPPDGVLDATVVGKKKRKRHRNEDSDSDVPGSMVSREQQARLDQERRERKKLLKKMAKRKKCPQKEEGEDDGSDTEVGKKRRKKKEGNKGIEAPYTKQYHEKKDIEKELDDMNYWDDENVDKKIDSEDTAMPKQELLSPSRLEAIMQEEGEVLTSGLGRPPHGVILPEGFRRDENGNIIRESDGKVITSEDLEQHTDLRRKLCLVFGLPRLIRNEDGRPLGGYKDDEFGPTAEWDYGTEEEKEPEEDTKLDTSMSAVNRQVVFSVNEKSVPPTPFTDGDLTNRRGRRLGSADRELLNNRLFGPNGGTTDVEHEKHLPVYFKGTKGNVNPDSIYVDPKDLSKLQRSYSCRPCRNNANGMILRSDTFDDGRLRRHNVNVRGNNGLRWAGRDVEVAGEMGRGKRNLGSDDEFLLLPGSFSQLNRGYDGERHICPRYERHGNGPAREESLLSDMSMRTAPDSHRPFSGDDRRLKHYLEEFYKDKKYLDYYVKTENLPTNAAVETKSLAHHGLDSISEMAKLLAEHEPVPNHYPPSDLALRLSRLHTMYTIADSGLHSMRSSDVESSRPVSAGNIQNVRRTDTALTRDAKTPNITTRSATSNDRPPVSGRSENAWTKRSSDGEAGLQRMHTETGLKMKEKSALTEKPETIPEELDIPGNVLTITDQ